MTPKTYSVLRALILSALFGLNANATAATIEEVIVTAQKREESLQTVPLAVTALQADDLAARSIGNLTEVFSQVPGLGYTPSTHGGSNANYYIRGIGQVDFISTTEPGVGVYLDGVYVARTVGGALDLLDIERVEVLRGPQGTLFGRNTIGGAVSVVTRDPVFEYEGTARLRLGERNRVDAGFSVNVPLLDDVLATRISFNSRNQDGYGRSLFDGEKQSDEGSNAGRITFLWNVTDNFEVTASGDFTRIREQAKHAISLEVNPNSFITADQNAFAIANGLEPFDNRWVPDDIYTNFAEFHPDNEVDIWGARVTAKWEITPAITLKSITAYRDMESDTGLDFDGSPSAISNQTVYDEQDQFSQELLLSGRAFDNRLDWLTGLYYLDESGFNQIELFLSFAENPFGFDTDTINDYDNSSVAVFGQGTWHFNDQLSFTGGVRWSSDDKEDIITATATKFGFDLVPPSKVDDNWDSVTWRVGAQYNFTEEAMGYVTYATGFKVGGFNGRPFSTAEALRDYDPEEVGTVEVGVKTDLFDKRLRLNVAGYYSDYSDIQVTVNTPDPLTGQPLNIVENAAAADIYGMELEAWLLLGDYWQLNFGANYIDAEYSRLDAFTNVTLDDDLPQTPDWRFNIGAEFSYPMLMPVIGDGRFTARADYYYTDDFYHNAQNSAFNHEPSYDLLHLRATIGPVSGQWSFAAYARNVLDQEYFSYREDLLLFTMATGVVAPPREAGVEFNFNW